MLYFVTNHIDVLSLMFVTIW